MQQLVLHFSLACPHAQFIAGVQTQVLPPTELRHVDEGELIRRRSIVFLATLFILLYDDIVAERETDQHMEEFSFPLVLP